MKMIVAYVQPHKLARVKQALFEANITKMSVTNARGCGQQMGYEEHYRGAVVDINLLQKARLEIAVNEEFVQTAIDAIIKAAKSGQIGDGKIFVLPIEQCVRIRTGETGSDAIG
jgi:nitrogen regulatory protein P-II 2